VVNVELYAYIDVSLPKIVLSLLRSLALLLVFSLLHLQVSILRLNYLQIEGQEYRPRVLCRLLTLCLYMILLLIHCMHAKNTSSYQ
jgi:hypothetical protein